MVLGLDFGTKNIGVAISNPERNHALAYKTFSRKIALESITQIVTDKKISTIVVGYPKQENEEGYIGKQARLFKEELEKSLKIEVLLVDEFMSTQLSIHYLQNLGYSKKSIAEKKDEQSAKIILQTYLDQIQ